MKSFICGLVLSLLVGAAAAQTKVGYVDIDTVTKRARQVNSAMSSIGGKVKQLQTDIDTKNEKIKQLKEDVQKNEGVLAKDEIDKKRKEIQNLTNEVEDLEMQGRRELQRVDDTFFSPLLKKIVYAIQDVANEKGLDLVLRGEAVLYGRDTVDITEDVIKKLNSEDFNTSGSRAEKTEKADSTSRPEKSESPVKSGATEGGKESAPAKSKASPKSGGARPVDRQPD